MISIKSIKHKHIKNIFILTVISIAIFSYQILFTIESQSIYHHLFSNYLIRKKPGVTTPTKCRVPDLKPYHPSISHLVSPNPVLICHRNEKYPLLFNSSVDPYPRIFPAKEFSQNPNQTNFIRNCSYQIVTRNSDPDDNNQYYIDFSYNRGPISYPMNLDQETRIPSGHDFIAISCDVGRLIKKYSNVSEHVRVDTELVDMHAFIHKKPDDKAEEEEKEEEMIANQSDKLNVIFMGIDSVSRMSFQRDFKKSYSYLMDNLSAVEMKAYHKMGDNTFPNVAPMLTNLPTISESKLDCEDETLVDNCPFIWKRFKEAGYQTLYAEDEAKLALFNLEKRGFKEIPTDYYLRPYLSAADMLIGHPQFRFIKSCLGPRPAFQVLLDYMQKMTFVMTNGEMGKKKYFQYTWASSSTHDNLNGGRPWDRYLRSSLEWWNNGGYLNDTVLILLSDHGIRWGKMHDFYQGQLEDRLPFMYIVVPPWFRVKYPQRYDNLIKNQNRLITALDVHQTLVDILIMGDSSLPWRKHPDIELTTGISLFQEIPEYRTCEMAGVEESYCTCNHEMIPLPVSNNLIQLAANFAVYHINKLISRYKECAYLSLDKVLQAGQVSFGDSEVLQRNNRTWIGYQLSIQTTPGNATFEAFIFWDKIGKWAVSGKIGRTNQYGNQSHCVKQKNMKLYCYCLDFLYNNYTTSEKKHAENPLVLQAANQVVQQINSLLTTTANHLCAYLSVDKILQARKIEFGKGNQSEAPWNGYRVTLQTTPGEGTFEAMVIHHYSLHKSSAIGAAYVEWRSIEGNASRENENKSWCLNDTTKVLNDTDKNNLNNAKPYCYCLPK